MSINTEEQDFIELAGGVRKVRTLEGSQFYGLPIGAPITTDIINAKNAEKAAQGIKPPAGAVGSGAKTLDGKDADVAKDAAAAAGAAEKPKLKLKIKKSTLKGNKHFTVGKSKYSAPNGSKLVRAKEQPGLAYILTSEGKVHAFNEAGEIEVPKTLSSIFETKFAGDLSADAKYAEEEFEATSSSYGIEGLQPGAVLNDERGTPQFKKLPDGTWEHVDLGVQLEEKDIQPLYDSGELIPEKNESDEAADTAFANIEATNFNDMSKEEFVAAFENMPVGTVIDVDGLPVTKGELAWTFDGGNVMSPQSAYYLKSMMKVAPPKSDEPISPLDGAAIYGPTLKKGDKPTKQWIDAALPGAQILYKGFSGESVWTKDEADSWSLANGKNTIDVKSFKEQVMADANKASVIKDGKDPKIGTMPDPAAKPATKPAARAPKAAPEAKAPAPKAAPVQREEEITPPAPVERKSAPATLIPGEADYTEKASADDITGAKAGDKVLIGFGDEYEFSDVVEYEFDGEVDAWLNTQDNFDVFGPVAMKQMATDQTENEQVFVNIKNSTKQAPKEEAPREEPTYGPKLTEKEKKAGLVPLNEFDTEAQLEELVDAPAGTKLEYNNIAGDKIDVFTKAEDGQWTSPTNGSMGSVDFDVSISKGKIKVISKPEAAPEAPKKDFDGLSQEDFSKKLVDAAPGTELIEAGKKTGYIKQESGHWTTSGGSKAVSHGVMYDKKDSLTMMSPETAKESLNPEPTTSDIPDWAPKGSIKIASADLGSVPIGGKVHAEHFGFEKISEGTYKDDEPTMGYVWDESNLGTETALYLAPSAGDKLPVVDEPTSDEIAAKASDDADAAEIQAYIDSLPDLPQKGAPATVEDVTGAQEGDILLWEGPYSDEPEFYEKKTGAFWSVINSESMDEVPSADLLSGLGYLFKTVPVGSEAPAPKKVGDPISSLEEMNALPAGSKLDYAKNDGGTSQYTKLKGDMWLTPGGGVLANHILKGHAEKGKFTLGSTPEAVAPVTEWGANEQLKDVTQLDDMPNGTTVSEKAGVNYTGIVYTKNDEGVWSNPVHGDQTVKEMADAIALGDLFYTAPPAAQASTDLDTQLWPGGTAFSKKEIEEAITAMEAHTSFHIKYGLKALSTDNALTETDVQDLVKAQALSMFPDMKPKPAFIAYLKTKIGITPEVIVKKEADPDAPKINIGSRTPESGVQGLDGGQFTQADIESAISILESFQGKIFKAELNKQGNPLGALDPNKLVGFDKDKTVTKQKLIELLKVKVANAKGKQQKLADDASKVSDMKAFEALPVGTNIKYVAPTGNHQFYEKTAPNAWTTDVNGSGYTLTDVNFETSVEKGNIFIESIPEIVPEYAQTPLAVQDKLNDELYDDSFSSADVDSASEGTLLQYTENGVTYAKEGTGWSGYNADGSYMGAISTESIKAWLEVGKVKKLSTGNPEYNKSGLVPGKYISGGKAAMYVHADGTGVYVNSKGDVSKMTVAKVKANYKAGMSNYAGMPDNIPTAPETAAKKTPAKKKPTSVVNIEDGSYFAGNPGSPKTTVYTVEGDVVTVFKPKNSTTGSSLKIGSKTNETWMEQSAVGSQFYYYSDKPENTYTKNAAGEWINNASNEPMTVDKVKDGPAYSYNYYYKVKSHGQGEASTITKAKLQTLFSQGKLLDADGNAVVPEGYSGAVTFFGAQSTIPGLIAAQKLVNDFDVEKEALSSLTNSLKNAGLYYDSTLLQKFAIKEHGEYTSQTVLDTLKAKIDQMVAGVDTDIPESDAAGLFDWNELGEAKMSVAVASLPAGMYAVHDYNNYIKTASASIGDGKIIGQHLNKMDKYDKSAWIAAFKAGNFKSMYMLEVAAAAQDGKAHSAGYLHPGYEGNAATNQIAWGAVVEGEISALTDVPGEWSSLEVEASMLEIDNYLIKAQMQNPTFLSNSEKRQWVKNHRNGSKAVVDQLSASALNRKITGQSEITEPLVWTDDLVPAKSYDSLFDDALYPTTGWTSDYYGTKAKDYYLDHFKDDEKLAAIVNELHKNMSESYAYKNGVSQYFQEKQAEADALALIPVYTLKPNQTVQKSTHPVFQYSDQFGNEFFFKPRANTKLDKYRSEVEHLGNMFGKAFGFGTSDSKLVTIDGKYGQLQKDVGGVTDLMSYDYSTLTAKQIADIGNEHMLDWFLDNDDTKGDNAKILPSGQIVGIDKGRAFKHYGAWNGLSGDSGMDTNAQTIYNKLYTSIRNGSISKEEVDKAYLAIQKKAMKMAKFSDAKITEMLAEGMVNREQFDNSYKIDGKKVPNSLEGLTAAVIDRKNKLPDEIEAMWVKIYKDAKFGDLPEKPDNPLGDTISGLDNAQLHDEVYIAEASGKTALIGGAHVIGGTALLWTDKDGAGATNVNGEMFLGPKKQKELLDYLMSNSTDQTGISTGQAQVVGFGNYDKFGSQLVAGAKTINHHAVDKNYNEATLASFEEAKKNLESDLSEWVPNITPNGTMPDGTDAYTFKSGHKVPLTHIDQYKMMLDFYAPKFDEVKTAHKENGKSGVIPLYAPLTLSKAGQKYSKGSETLTELGDGSFIHNDGIAVQQVSKDWAETKIESGNGWTSLVPAPEEKATASVSIVKLGSTHEKNAKIVGHTKTITGTSGGIAGSSGQEYEITLATGEKIYFRNAGNTDTKRGQHGKLVFRIEGAEDAAASQAAIARVMEQLNAMGIATDAADHTSAELTYWREMYGVLENRNHESGSKYAKAKAKMDIKVKEIGGKEEEFLENLSEAMEGEDEIQFWRELYSEFWPKEVDKLIADEGYLPKFDHQNLKNSELETGKPYWERFDISLADVYEQDKMLMSSTGGEPTPMIQTGAALSAEERLRQADAFSTGWSAGQDQSYGSSHNIYTRINSTSDYSSYNAFYDPRMMLRTRTYSFNGDNYGNLANRKASAPSNPIKALKSFGGGSNETMLPHMATLLDGVEIYTFDYAEKRNEMIQYLKSLGIDQIRGLPIEDRLVMKNQTKAAIEKVKKQWAIQMQEMS